MQVVEIFRSLQGEGRNVGKPVVFIRLAYCNLCCEWCDTDWTTSYEMSSMEIVDTVKQLDNLNDQPPCNNVIITGGEPMFWELQGLEELVEDLKREGYWIGIETNGTINIDTLDYPAIDYIATSPKRAFKGQYVETKMLHVAHEVRIVCDGFDSGMEEFCRWAMDHIVADNYYLSPLEKDGTMNYLETIALIGRLNERKGKTIWRLSVQTHKLTGIR